MRKKKCLWSRDVRWPASIFPSSHFTFSSSKKLNFLIQSNIRQVPNILVFLSSCTRPTSFAWLSGRTLSLLQLECSREEECLVRAKNFSARNPQLFSFSSLLTEVPKNRSHPRLIQEYFSCLFFFFRWRASILLNCSSVDNFVFFSSSKSPCGNLDYLTGLFVWSDVVELETQEKKFDCDNYSWRKTRKTKRTCWQVWIFITLTRWLSTMMRKDFRLNCSDFIFSTTCLESGNAEFIFSEEIIRRLENYCDTRQLWADFQCCSSLLLEADGRFSFF